MADPVDEFERILRETHNQLGGIRLELPDLEDGSPAPMSPQAWAAENLSLERRPEEEKEEEPQQVQSVELPPSPPIAEPEPVARPAPTEQKDSQSAPRPWYPGIIAAIVVLAAGFGLWRNLHSTLAQTVLPLASFDAIAARDPDEWLVSRQGELALYDASSKPHSLAPLSKPLTSLFWTDGTLYGIDGGNTLFLWDRLDLSPKTFSLDHVPLAIYARPPHVWTLDAGGNLRQFILALSMTSVFLQPLDRVAIHHAGDFSVAPDGSILLLERSTGQLLSLTREQTTYNMTMHGSSYGAGSRLLSSSRGLWIARANDGQTSLLKIPKPPR